MPKILIVDDHPETLRGLEVNLKGEGYSVLLATRGEDVLRLTLHENPALILLDVMLPGMNGYDVCRELRRKGIETPIILLTAKSEDLDKVVGFEIGADDYVTKPFSIRELLARIRTRLRRQPPSNSAIGHYVFDGIEIDFDKLRCTCRGEDVKLSAREFDLLKLLIRERGNTVSRNRMLAEACGYDAEVTTRTIDTHISRLRRKLERAGSSPGLIISVYNGGYRFVG